MCSQFYEVRYLKAIIQNNDLYGLSNSNTIFDLHFQKSDIVSQQRTITNRGWYLVNELLYFLYRWITVNKKQQASYAGDSK